MQGTFYPVNVATEFLAEFREELEDAHQEMEILAVQLEQSPQDAPTLLTQLVEQLEALRLSATKLDLAPLSESLGDAIQALDKLRHWGQVPEGTSEFILLLIDRLQILAREVQQEQVIDIRKTQHLLVSLQHLVLAPSPEELPRRMEAALIAITREIYEQSGELQSDTDILLFDEGGEEIELFDSAPAPEPKLTSPQLHLPKADTPLARAREFILHHPKAPLWHLLGQASDNATHYRGTHTEFTLHLVLAVNFLAGEPLDSEELFLGVCIHDLGLATVAELLADGRPFTPEVQERVHRHPLLAAPLVPELGGGETAQSVVLHHHERLNGTGYPNALKGGQIGEGGRLMAIVDSFHAMIEKRPHRRYSRSVLRAMAEINATSGRCYDSTWVGLFNRCIRQYWLAEQPAPNPAQ